MSAGRLKALAKDWRCRVLAGGRIALGDPVEALVSPRQAIPRLPG